MPPTLLLDPSRLRLDLLRADYSSITAVMATTPTSSPCPLCDLPSSRVHSRYVRTLADLPWHGVAVSVQLTVRRFVCETDDCTRRIFGERLAGIVAPYARRTARLGDALELIGFALGGEAGARVLRQLAMVGSPDTLLRTIRAASLAEHDDPRVLGVDDFAFRRGHRYGTILVDLERHCAVDLLPDRKPETLIAWLEHHTRPAVISRDRGGSYGEAGRRGAPDAVQVADRFHLTKNLVEALERFFLRHRSALKDVAITVAEERAPTERSDLLHDEMYRGKRTSPQNWAQRAEEASVQRHAPHVARYEEVHVLHEKGVSIAEIARRAGVARKTVYVYLRMDQPPERKRPVRNPNDRVLAPYEPYLLTRWEEGCRNGLQLWREIQDRGYVYSRASVARFVAQLRRATPGAASRSGITYGQGPPARRVAFLAVQRSERLKEEETAYLTHLRAHDETIETACRLSQGFAQMVRDRQGAQLDAWINEARASGIGELERFAAGLLTDEAAVRTGLTLVWSNAQVEGQVNRLKLIKRAMYGRGNFDLLRQRVLHAA
jgi:transposase